MSQHEQPAYFLPVNEPASICDTSFMGHGSNRSLQLANMASRTMLLAEAWLSCLDIFALAPRHLSLRQWLMPAHAPCSQTARVLLEGPVRDAVLRTKQRSILLIVWRMQLMFWWDRCCMHLRYLSVARYAKDGNNYIYIGPVWNYFIIIFIIWKCIPTVIWCAQRYKGIFFTGKFYCLDKGGKLNSHMQIRWIQTANTTRTHVPVISLTLQLVQVSLCFECLLKYHVQEGKLVSLWPSKWVSENDHYNKFQKGE